MKTKHIVVRQDTLEALQADGSWGEKSTAKEYSDNRRAFDAANKASEAIEGRMVTVQPSIKHLLAK